MMAQTRSDQTRQAILDAGRRLVQTGGFGAVGLKAILAESGVPKGSFYYYFPSKEAFGEAMLQDYVADYLARIDGLFDRPGTGADKLMTFCEAWLDREREAGLAGTCLVVKLGAEVSDLSEPMRLALDDGVTALTARLAEILREGIADGSIRPLPEPDRSAEALYAQWLGAAILSKLSHDQAPLKRALDDTRLRLIPDAQKGQDQ